MNLIWILILLSLKNREAWVGREIWDMACQWNSQNTYSIYWFSSLSYMDTTHGNPNQLSSNIKDHWLFINITNIIKFEVLQELPQRDTVKKKRAKVLEKMVPLDLLTYYMIVISLLFVKTKTPVKHNKAKLNKRKYACI